MNLPEWISEYVNIVEMWLSVVVALGCLWEVWGVRLQWGKVHW